jgi:hypothetical protein
MATKAHAWPTNAAEARDRSAEEAVLDLQLLEPMLERDMTETERVRRLARAISSFHKIARLLERAGAQTRP